MKKIGVLYGKERSFPMAFIEAVNGKNMRGIHAESVLIDKVIQGHPSGYSCNHRPHFPGCAFLPGFFKKCRYLWYCSYQ